MIGKFFDLQQCSNVILVFSVRESGKFQGKFQNQELLKKKVQNGSCHMPLNLIPFQGLPDLRQNLTRHTHPSDGYCQLVWAREHSVGSSSLTGSTGYKGGWTKITARFESTLSIAKQNWFCELHLIFVPWFWLSGKISRSTAQCTCITPGTKTSLWRLEGMGRYNRMSYSLSKILSTFQSAKFQIQYMYIAGSWTSLWWSPLPTVPSGWKCWPAHNCTESQKSSSSEGERALLCDHGQGRCWWC